MKWNELPHPWDQKAMREELRDSIRQRIRAGDTMKPVYQFTSGERAEQVIACAHENWPFIAAAGYMLEIKRPDFTWDAFIKPLPISNSDS